MLISGSVVLPGCIAYDWNSGNLAKVIEMQT